MLSTSPHIRAAASPDGAVILDIEHNTITTLNTTGGLIWTEVQAGKTISEIIHDLACKTGQDPLLVEHDVKQFLEQLVTNRLVNR
jgi:hypothetical protein